MQIAAAYAEHRVELHSAVRRRGSRHPATVDDACAHAWEQPLGAEHVDVLPPGRCALPCLRHMRLELVAQIPERPRRFLLRLAIGYSYHEIAARDENVTLTTTNKQIARARRIVRELETVE